METARLVDHFVIIGYDEKAPVDSKNFGQGKVLWQCPPAETKKPFWSGSYGFPDQLAKMCMPLGWRSSSIYQEPTYFCSQLTSDTAKSIIFACFTMYEPILQMADETLMPRELMQSHRGDAFSISSGEDVVYCPKCLIILSSHRYPDTFKQILCQLYNIGMREVSAKEKNEYIETAVANLIGFTHVPSPRIDNAFTQQFELLAGLPQLSFVIPKDPNMPMTGKTVLELFNYVGTSNALAIVIAVLAGVKVVLCSVSLTKLAESINAVISLLYPLQGEHEGNDGRAVSLMSTIRVPVLPHDLVRYVNSPFPYIYGVHTSLMDDMRSQCDSDLSDILIADLDNNFVQLPRNENDLSLPERVHSQVLAQLQMIIDPTLQERDRAFPPTFGSERSNSSSELNSFRKHEFIDKQIRAVFMQLLAHIMHKYRQCLVVVRVHPDPVLKLDKFSFMKARPDLDKTFLEKFLNDNMLFNNFIEARGSPYRTVDLMDSMINSDNLETFSTDKTFSRRQFFESIDELAKFLAANETPSSTTTNVCVTPTRRWDTNYVFPVNLNVDSVLESIKNGLHNRKPKISLAKFPKTDPCTVPGTIPSDYSRSSIDLDFIGNGAGPEMQLPAVKKRLDGLEKCISSIFEGRISDAHSGLDTSVKILNSTLCAKRLLVHRLREHAADNLNDTMRPVELNIRLLHFLAQLVNEALVFEDGTEVDHDIVRGVLSIASCYYCQFKKDLSLLPLASSAGGYASFYPANSSHLYKSATVARLGVQNFSQLQQHVAKSQGNSFGTITDLDCPAPSRLPHQYLCTLIQGHPVWHSHQFWIHAFYLDVEKQLHKMYAKFGPNGEKLLDNRSTIERVAEQLKDKQKFSLNNIPEGLTDAEREHLNKQREEFEHKRNLMVGSEKQNAFSQALDYLTQIVQLQMPLRTPVYRSRMPSKTYSSKSGGGESGSTGRDDEDQVMNESSPGEIEKFLSRFLQDAMENTQCGRDYSDKAQAEMQNIMEQQAQTLSEIYTAAKEGDDSAFYPQKFRPVLLPKEDYVTPMTEQGGEEGLPIRLLADMKTYSNPLHLDLPYLPANGNVYLTNYRIIVIAHPRHVLTCDQLIYKSFPISMLLKMEKVEEKIRSETANSISSKEVTFHSKKVWQFVFANFQVMRIVFDADLATHVSDKRAEAFVETVKELRRAGDNYNFYFLPAYLFVASGGISNSANREGASRPFDYKETLPVKQKSRSGRFFDKVPKGLMSAVSGSSSSYQNKRTMNRGLPATIEIDDDFADDGFAMRGASNGGPLASTQTIERLEKSRVVQDYLRMLLGSSRADSTLQQASTWGRSGRFIGPDKRFGGSHHSQNQDFMITYVNSKYECCETYPPALVIPSGIDEQIVKSVKVFYRSHRFPVITWRDRKGNGTLLIRASCMINSRNVFQPFKKPNPVGSTVSDSSGQTGGATKELRDYIRALIDVIPKPSGWTDHVLASPFPGGGGGKRSSRSSSEYQVSKPGALVPLSRTSSEMVGYGGSPKKAGKITKLANKVGTLTSNFGGSGTITTPKTLSVPKRLLFGGGSSSHASSSKHAPRKKGFKSKMNPGQSQQLKDDVFSDELIDSLPNSSQLDDFGGGANGSETSSICSQASLPFTSRNMACLYIFVSDVKDKKNPLLNIGAAAEVVAIDGISSSKLRDRFINLMNAVASPDAPKRAKSGSGMSADIANDPAGGGSGVKSQTEHVDKWLQKVSKLIYITMQVVAVLAQEKSVMLCLEDHNDMTAQVMSLAQVLLDVEYRTVEGFCTLIEKEWLWFGHRFKYKTGQFDFPANGFCPTFLLFLDAVYQALCQYPTEFEFNSFFLQTIAYHHISNRFSTFLGNSDWDRVRYQATLSEQDISTGDGGSELSFWKYLSTVHASNPCFINYNCSTFKDFSGSSSSLFGGLCLNWSLPALQLWEFYLPESLTDANLYELDLEANPYQPDQNSMLLQGGGGGFGTIAAETPVTNASAEVQQSLVNASVSQVQFQDELSVCLKRALDYGVLDPNQPINHYYRSCCPQKQLQVIGWSSSYTITADSLLRDLAFKSLEQSSSSNAKSIQASYSGGPSNSSSNVSHQFTAFESNVDHCQHCKQKISPTIPGVLCSICDLVLHKSCSTTWSKRCKRRKETLNSAMVKSDSFTFKNGISANDPMSGSGEASSHREGTDYNGNVSRQSAAYQNQQPRGFGLHGERSDTISKYSNRMNRKLEKVIMYKQTRHLRQWKKQMVEYQHDGNLLRFLDPHIEHGGSSGTSKCKEIAMNRILRVSLEEPRKWEIVLPNHFEGFSMIRMELETREYFLLVKDPNDATRWTELLQNRIAD